MCLICDGYTPEQVERAVDLAILTHGWFLQQVEEIHHPWSYTVGLSENYSHPELVVVDGDFELQAGMIRWAVGMIQRDGAIDPEQVRLSGASLATVHPTQLRNGMFGSWTRRYGGLPPDGAYCSLFPPPARATATRRRLSTGSTVPTPPRSVSTEPSAAPCGDGADAGERAVRLRRATGRACGERR